MAHSPAEERQLARSTLAATGTLSREPIPHLSEPWYC